MPSLCCFWDPAKEYTPRELTDVCPTCGRTYGHPLTHYPRRVGDFEIVGVIDRGFYGAIYVGERGFLRSRSVLKVVPKRVYEVFGKDFYQECQDHAEVSAGTMHLVGIRDVFDADVVFDGEDEPLECHVAELDHVDGVKLSSFFDEAVTATQIAQVAIDLFRLLSELENKQKFHNDLHGGNIVVRRLPPEERRLEAIDHGIVAIAVDLGSMRDGSRSDEEQQTGDLHHVAAHLLRLVDRLLDHPERGSDLEYRLASALQEIAHMLSPESAMQRTPNYDDYIDMIHRAFELASSPWKEPAGGLRSFGESYNAQTLRAWFVPQLLVDPGGWQAQIETAGPQIITGMRGCGKTMLLRSLQFHARASLAVQRKREAGTGVAEQLQADGYVGLYVSCMRLLDRLGSPTQELHQPYARLFLVYAREALRALRHLRELQEDRPLIAPVAYGTVARAVSDFIEEAGLDGCDSELVLERRLQEMQISLERGDSRHSLSANPAVAFPRLAEAITACSPLWQNARVLFLLDDVSTRHLHEDAIRELISVSTLMFSHEQCSFKLTTEAQTLELVLHSPGLVEKARPGRDYQPFDLGEQINQKLNGPDGKGFISEVLRQRAAKLQTHPNEAPRDVLGDCALEDIARTIAASSKDAPAKKSVYHGLSALTALCVGDIGDVISIYELMLSRVGRVDEIPIAARVQSSCFQEYCNRRLYHLNRRAGELKDFALGFGEAAHDLLMQSRRTGDEKPRLRQYAKVYVRVTTGDADAQLARLRELTDAGVFVLDGGPEAPRTKTRDSNPMSQFILTYRKLFGLSNFIGLANRDRFELSGDDLAEWLSHPERTREILMRNLKSGGDDADVATHGGEASTGPVVEGRQAASEIRTPPRAQHSRRPARQREPTLFDAAETANGELPALAKRRVPRVTEVDSAVMGGEEIHTVILGRGFEERALASTRRLLECCQPERAILIRYPLEGHGPEIEALVGENVQSVEVVDYADAVDGLALPEGQVLVDVTGLAKPVIFGAVRRLLRDNGRVAVAHTGAEVHYPLNDDIDRALRAHAEGDAYTLLEALSDVLTGEARPYAFDKLLTTDADDGRRRLLCAAASPKHERLMSLIDERDYDRVDVIVPSSDSPRAQLARLAADVASKDFHSSSATPLLSDDLAGTLAFIAEHYQRYYVDGNFDFELGLTGSKLHAVACAAAASSLRMAQCWYVRPSDFDTDRFTVGVGESRYFLLRRDPPDPHNDWSATAGEPAATSS